MAATSGVPIYADTAALSRLSRSLRRASPEVWSTYKIAVREGAQALLADMESRASYSAQIPQSGVVKVTAGGNVKIVFSAPNAAPIENKGKGYVRHPVFGNRENWTNKNSHPPFAAPALADHQEELVALIENALTDAIDRVLKGI